MEYACNLSEDTLDALQEAVDLEHELRDWEEI